MDVAAVVCDCAGGGGRGGLAGLGEAAYVEERFVGEHARANSACELLDLLLDVPEECV